MDWISLFGRYTQFLHFLGVYAAASIPPLVTYRYGWGRQLSYDTNIFFTVRGICNTKVIFS